MPPVGMITTMSIGCGNITAATMFIRGVAHGVSANGWVGRPHHLPEEQMHTFWCIDRTLNFLQKRDPTVPFFLNISFYRSAPTVNSTGTLLPALHPAGSPFTGGW